MGSYSPASCDKLETCHEEIAAVCLAVIPIVDHVIIWGVRFQVAQDQAFESGHSTKRWPMSKHNAIPPGLSDAVDIAPWFRRLPHIRWDHEREFIYLAGHMMQAAAAIGVKLRWGGDWNMNKNLYDVNKPFDLGHFERI